MPTRVIAFDLDMTLVDSRDAIAGALDLLSAETGVAIDSAGIVAMLGPPIRGELLRYFGEDGADEAVARFRHHLRETTMPLNRALPGAVAVVTQVCAAGVQVAVITAKHQPLAELTLETVGMKAHHIVGDVWAEDKAPVLRSLGALAYVGDHPRDMVAAKLADATAIGVTTGAATRAELLAAGAYLVVGSLEDLEPNFWTPTAIRS